MSTFGSGRGMEVTIKKASKTAQVKNRSAAPIQISSEQLLREARDRKIELEPRAPRQQITDKAELQEYRMRRRKEFEDQIRMQRQHLGNYVKYAKWEEEQQEFERARSIFERAVDTDYRNQSLWLKYSEMEMRNKFVNSARNVYDRAVQLLPRVDQFWYKYTYMEEMLGNFKLCRQVFQRWMKWEPDENAFASFAKFEMRRGDEAAAREVYEAYVDVHPTLRAFLKYAKWEERQQQVGKSRVVYERALVELPDEEERNSEKLFISLAQFEERQTEHERTRVVYKFALDRLGRAEMPELYKQFIAFEKKHGSMEGIEDAIVGKRRLQYEDSVSANPHDYDAWFDYIRLEEEEGNVERCREVYERAVAQVPPVHEKRFWRRYVYLWVNYALFEELQAKDVPRAREVYKALLATIPHETFSFAKAFALAAQLEVRQRDLGQARKLLGQGIGRTGKLGKEKVFKDYIHLERQLGEVDRCRTLYGKYLEAQPTNVHAWSKFAELEVQLGEVRRARAVFELAVAQPQLDMPELLWKQYIDFEISTAQEGEEDDDEDNEDEDKEEGNGKEEEEDLGLGGKARRVRELYERLLDRTQHVKVWVSYASFEATGTLPDSTSAAAAAAAVGEGQGGESSGVGGGIACARTVFRRAYAQLKDQGLREERVLLLEAWRDLEKRLPRSAQLAEQSQGSVSGLAEVTKLMPKKVKKRRLIAQGGGEGQDQQEEEEGWEEYYEYQFPDDQTAPMNLKILEMARMWKQTGAMPASEDPAPLPPQPPPGPPPAAPEGSEGSEEGTKKRKAEDDAEIDIDGE